MALLINQGIASASAFVATRQMVPATSPAISGRRRATIDVRVGLLALEGFDTDDKSGQGRKQEVCPEVSLIGNSVPHLRD
jgi:hypothetical protein